MKVAFTFNTRHVGAGVDVRSQSEAEFDEPATIEAIQDAIERSGVGCVPVEADEDAFERLRSLRGEIDLVYNIAEGRGASREAHIPTILEILEIPSTHSNALTHAISLDKALTKKIWRFHELPTPRFVLFGPCLDGHQVDVLRFPVLVKPNAEGSSKGIFDGNLIGDPRELVAKVEEIGRLVGGHILVEEFLEGREFTVTVLGNEGVGDGLYTLPIAEQDFDLFPDRLHPFESYEAKWFFEGTEEAHAALRCPASVSPELELEIVALAKRAFLALQCRDIARVDIRLDGDGFPHLLEINTLPGMHHDPELISYYPVAARAAGWTYDQAVVQVLTHAVERLDRGPVAWPAAATPAVVGDRDGGPSGLTVRRGPG